MKRSHRGEELIQIEGQRVELLAPRIGLERPEPVPPVHPPVFLGSVVLLVVKRGVQEVCQQSSYEGLGGERDIDHVVELQKKKIHGKGISWSVNFCA